MSHLPPWLCSQVGFLCLLLAVSRVIGFSTPLGSPAWRDKTPAALWLCSLLLAMLQGAITIFQTHIYVVCWLRCAFKCSRRAVSPSESFFWHKKVKKVLLDHMWSTGVDVQCPLEVKHHGGLWRWVRSTGANNHQALSSLGFLFIF